MLCIFFYDDKGTYYAALDAVADKTIADVIEALEAVDLEGFAKKDIYEKSNIAEAAGL